MAPNSLPSNLNLALMNLFIGMCKGVVGLASSVPYPGLWKQMD